MQKKIKVLWLVNIVLPDVSEAFNQKKSVVGGWLTGLFRVIKNDSSIEPMVVFPLYGETGFKKVINDGISFYGVGVSPIHHIYHKSTEQQFDEILSEANPDIVHIFGTEFPHTLAMINAYNRPNRTVINIQGLCSVYANHYFDGLPDTVVYRKNVKEILKGGGLLHDRRLYVLRGEMEVESLMRVHHVIGRTTWDYACCMQINKDIRYHHVNESLRDSFYDKKWDINRVERHTIFISQATYPIKGFHYALLAMGKVIKRFPDAKIMLAGPKTIHMKENKIKSYLRNSYKKYIKSLIKQYHLENHIVFLGSLDEEKMRNRYLKTHLFVSPSAIENSPNSVGEAMLLGVPVVASDVGGVRDLLEHGTEGYVYQSTAPYMLAHYICDLFENDQTCVAFSEAARKHASQTHEREKNAKETIDVYRLMMEDER